MTFFHTFMWATVVVAVIGFIGTVMLGVSNLLIPWGLRLPKKDRHPLKKRPATNNACNESTTSRQEWWGANFKIFGWALLSISFFIQIFVAWPV
ncbi:MAG: hypothetical protein P4M14_10140 [Gammaproteobacteria bacterium]|nr:hypothetical protein [Gammaproteobacteria bacterium]